MSLLTLPSYAVSGKIRQQESKTNTVHIIYRIRGTEQTERARDFLHVWGRLHSLTHAVYLFWRTRRWLKGTLQYESILIFALWYQLGAQVARFKAWLKQTRRYKLACGRRDWTTCSLPACFALIILLTRAQQIFLYFHIGVIANFVNPTCFTSKSQQGGTRG